MTLIDRLSKLDGPDGEDAEAWEELCKLTFAIQHNPNCPAKFLIRLPGKSGRIDMKPYADRLGFIRHQTGDILGFGKTLHEAASIALLRAKEVSNDK